MTNLNELVVTNREYDLDSGFFWVEFEDGRSLQCCLKGKDGNHVGYAAQIEASDTGFDQGVSWDCNEWAAGKDGYAEHIEEFLISQARRAGIQIVA